MSSFLRNYLYPIATMIGSIVGIGFLALPYVASQTGFWLMLWYFIALTALVITIHLIFCEISLRTPDYKRFPGFVGYYLGKWPKNFALALMVFGIFGVLLAYLLVGGNFLMEVFSPAFGGSLLAYVAAYFALMSIVIYFDARVIAKIEVLALSLLSAALLLVFAKSWGHIRVENLLAAGGGLQFSHLFLPYGPILFSLWSTGMIPEIEEMLMKKKKLLKRIVIIATLVPAAAYAVFTAFIVGISGSNTTEFALTGLAHFVGNGVLYIALFMGAAAIFAAFVSNGLILKKVFMYDMGMKKFPAWALTCFPPMILLLLGFNAFIPLISFIGSVFVGISGILILLMYKKIGGKKSIIYPLAGVFVLGIAYEILYFWRF